MEKRVYNFAAGPSAMPEEVLKEAQRDLLCYPGAGCSVMEMSHRSAEFQKIAADAESSLRRLMDIPEEYAVLFLQGGASMQFSEVPMNLTHQGETTAYIVSGSFAGKAFEEAKRWGNAVCVGSSEEEGFTFFPKIKASDIPKDAKYLHITGNNTVFGLCCNTLPETGGVPIAADWSSAILGREIDVRKHGLIYAGAQKNIGPAGLTLVIVRKDLILDPADRVVPTMLRYKPQIDADSMYNTPPCFAIYMAGLNFKWLESQGGVAEMEKRNKAKAKLLYDLIDASDIYSNRVNKEDRSITNVTFTLPTKEATDRFIAEAKDAGIINIKGHKAAGGLRASIYNGVSMQAVEYLAEFMEKFRV